MSKLDDQIKRLQARKAKQDEIEALKKQRDDAATKLRKIREAARKK